jgi:hypothetical protein
MPMTGAAGYFVNGLSAYGWSDATSYNSAGVWYNLAPEFEVYDLDVCNGHAASGDYHHHHYPACLAKIVNDTGKKHSPIYGFANDGYPIYGPYSAAGTLAGSCWMARDYSASSPTGCSTSTRCCQLLDQEDYTTGTKTVTCGPSLTGTVSTQSGNTISAASGIYIEDYYFNASCAAKGGRFLDKHNGHSHGSYGYHYHVTVDSSFGAVFPYYVGPKYYGCRSSGACCTSLTSQSCSSSGSVCGTSDGTSTFACSTGVWDTSSTDDDVIVDDTLGGDDTVGSNVTVSASNSEDGLSGQNKIIIIVVVVVVGGLLLVLGIAYGLFGYFGGSSTAAGVPVKEPNKVVPSKGEGHVAMVAVNSHAGVNV